MFGLILTRLRSRLRTKAMADLAELRLHLRDEHLRQGLVKARLQRSTTSHENAGTGAADPQEASLAPASQQPPSAVQDHADTLPGATDETDNQTLHAIADLFIQQVDEDEDFIAPGSQPQGAIQITIAHLFNFSNSYWTTHLKAFASRSLNDELELYELIEAESDGDVSAGHEMDEMVEASMQ
jgi:hypothetical protein